MNIAISGLGSMRCGFRCMRKTASVKIRVATMTPVMKPQSRARSSSVDEDVGIVSLFLKNDGPGSHVVHPFALLVFIGVSLS